MTQTFELRRMRDIAPSCGEDLGAALARFAAAEEERFRSNPDGKGMHWAGTVAQVLYLAAEAFEAGAAASIGHSRADRYEERARALRAGATALEAEAAARHNEVESARLIAAFDDGYAGRDIKRHSFEAREAALVGQRFAKEGRGMPRRINKVYAPRPLGRDSERDYLAVDGERFIVDYPGGSIADAIVTKLD